ncbi:MULTISPECIES: tetratricopeptide repeat protein [Ramlibacter]|jgi:Tfp pilus assembly protein PilF|uniref:Tetratricopeptide repeat protein n=1 Tax=Ramlibacter pinisoli TaxID=2682844 RepID=A0A6N8IPD0_9BURK|nr:MULTISPECIES: tetratricopeptide repeat protein [Ramlibacter]MBA2963772.1 tetratricopeptide repeat protein [Ramlibacter sp. CGMCC 1.13660]MVQ28739.1 tetratricopeptide repeat protein [Ramlibacter pinisoli]
MRILRLVLSFLLLAAASLTASAAGGGGGSDLAVGPSTAQRLATAQKAIDAQDWSAAQRELTTLLREEPRNPDAHTLMGYTMRKRPNPDLAKAFQHYERAIALDPKHKGAHEYIGEAYLMEKKPAEAEKHLVRLEQICGGTACEQYQDLAKSIAEYKAKN